MANILHALSHPVHAEPAHAILLSYRWLVDGQEHFMRLSQQHAYTTSGRIHEGRDIDLGPLVGSTRGFRTKERVLMSGGLGGMQMDGDVEAPVVHVSVQSPTPQRRSTQGK